VTPVDAERLRRLQQVTDAALAHLQLEELLRALLARTRDLLEVDTCAILLLDEERGELVAQAAVGLDGEVEPGVRVPLGVGFVGRVAAERRPIVVDDAEIVDPSLRAKGVKALLGVPLVVEGTTLGVLHVGSLADRRFDQDDVDLLQVVADRASIGIAHARLYEAEREARARLEHVQTVMDAALAHLELDDLLAELLARVRGILGADTAAVLLLDEERRELVARAAVGLEEEAEHGVRIPLDGGFASRVAAEQRPIVLDDLGDAEIVNPILREKGVRSLLGVPLVAGGETIGVLHVGTRAARKFRQSDVDLLQLVADRASIAIEHARLYAAERAARTRLEHIQAVTDAALAHLDLEDLLTELLARIREILAADTAAILLLDEERRELVARAAVGLEEEVERGVRIPFGRGFAGRIAEERRPVVLDDVDRADIANPILREKGLKSMLGVPLLVRGEPIGVIHVGTLTPRAFTREDVELLQLVAERSALAIANARVHDEIVRLDQLKLNFVAVASHELRTPAAGVYGILATLRERGDELPEETRAELFEHLWDQADRLRRLIEQLLDLSRLDAHALPIEPQPLVLNSVVGEAVGAAAPGAAERVRVEIDPALAVVADPVGLERILTNLVGNALRHGRPPVVVSAEARDRHVRVAVEDEGEGVPPELQPRLFDRFERGPEGQGTGLGLAIAKAYARAHGGDLVYQQGARGARFELILPRK
jgi:GAF domain-containing protein